MNSIKGYNIFILNKTNNTKYWCVYHSDDSGVALVFNNINQNYEEFSETDCYKIKEHLNKYGYEIEHQDCVDFCDVTFNSEIQDKHEFHIFNAESDTDILLDLFSK